MDYVDVPRLNDVPVAAITIIDEKKIIRFACFNRDRYIFKFNGTNEFEYCTYRNADMQETTDTEKIPDFKKALDMATNEICGRILARGK